MREGGGGGMSAPALEDPSNLLDTSGRTLRRRLNWTLALQVLAILGAIACIALIAVAISKLGDASVSASQASQQYAQLQSLLKGLPANAASTAFDDSLFRCPRGLLPPRKWLVLGSDYARGGSGSPVPWYQQMAQLAGPNREVLVPQGASVRQQLASLESDERFAIWRAASEPLLVLYEYGFFESLAALVDPTDPRAASPAAVRETDVLLLRQPWIADAVVVILVPTLPYSPKLGGYVSAAQQPCSNPLARRAFNEPESFALTRSLSHLSPDVALAHALSAADSTSVVVVSTDWLFARYGLTAHPASDLADVAFSDDCISLNQGGQQLLARYIWSCLLGTDESFALPDSLISQ